jgi:hypothetical protein
MGVHLYFKGVIDPSVLFSSVRPLDGFGWQKRRVGCHMKGMKELTFALVW